MQRTFVIFKPDCMAQRHVGNVLNRFESAGFTVVGCKMARLSPAKLREHYDVIRPQGAFYFYPRCPKGVDDREFVRRALAKGLLVVPGSACSMKSTHFRLSYAVPDPVLERGLDLLKRLAKR